MNIKEIAAITNHTITRDMILDTPTFDYVNAHRRVWEFVPSAEQVARANMSITITAYRGSGGEWNLLLNTLLGNGYAVFT